MNSRPIPVPIALRNSNQNVQVIGGGGPASSPLPVRVAPRFRPTRSGYGTGPLESHPFHHADRAENKSDAIQGMLRMQTSNPPLSSRPGAEGRALKTANRSKRRHIQYPYVAGRLHISVPSTFGSHRAGEVPLQCHHRRGREASLPTSNQHAEVVIRILVTWQSTILSHPTSPKEIIHSNLLHRVHGSGLTAD